MGLMRAATVQLEETSCWCGTPVAVPSELLRHAMRNGTTAIYCPHGHTFVFTEGENKKLRDALTEQTKRATEMAERARKAEDREALVTSQLKRHQKRTAAGVCPCCNRTFQQLARHMKTKHPEAVK